MSLGLAWKTYANRGHVIFITFLGAAGLPLGQSLLKCREVLVSQVESVGFTSDLKSVLVGIQIQKDIARRIDSGTKFRIVRPQIDFNRIFGLNIVLSGVYFEELWDDSRVGSTLASYEGVKKLPLATTVETGKWVTLWADDGDALMRGALVIFRGIQVGELRNLRLDEAGSDVLKMPLCKGPMSRN